MYENGQNVMVMRMQLNGFESAADQGRAGAQNNLGVMYANGKGVEQKI